MSDWWSSDISADDPYSKVPAVKRATVKQMLEGRMNPPAGAALRSEPVQRLMDWANNVDPTFDASVFKARSDYRSGLSKTSPSSPGGQRNAVNTMAGHLADASDHLVDLHNKDLGVTFLTAPVNAIRGMSTEQAAKINALKDSLQKYGAEVTKFYAGAPGGEHERQAQTSYFGENKSPQELAAALQSELGLFKSKADIMERQKNEAMGKHGADIQIMSPESLDAFKKVRRNVSLLKGEPVSVETPEEAAKLPKGTKILLPDGSPGVVP